MTRKEILIQLYHYKGFCGGMYTTDEAETWDCDDCPLKHNVTKKDLCGADLYNEEYKRRSALNILATEFGEEEIIKLLL